MGATTKIEWADHTFNPWIGCTKVSAACDFCYAEAWDKRFGGEHWGPHAERRRTSAANWQQPLRWNREAEAAGVRPRVFCASLADVFDNAVPAEWRNDLWYLIASTPHLDWLLLTKRPQNIAKMLPVRDSNRPGYRPWNGPWHIWPWPNVWLGTTVEDQEEANRRIPVLLSVSAAKHFLSAEPLLGPVDLTAMPFADGDPRHHWDALTGQALMYSDGIDGHPDVVVRLEKPIKPRLDQVIVGGESGPGARPMHPAWARSLRDQCQAAGVPYFFKQWGEWLPDFEKSPVPIDDDMEQSRFETCVWNDEESRWDTTNGCWDDHENWLIATDYWQPEQSMRRVGKKRAGRQLEGRTWDEVPG